MMGAVHELALRRKALVADSAAQRAAIGAALRPAASRLAALDRIVAAVRQRPVLVSIAVVAFLLLRPRRLLPLALRALPFIALLRRL
jgi:hypothetical protein